MNKIFLICEPIDNSTDVMGAALAEDGEWLTSHISSNVDWNKHDMGLTSNWKHEEYQKHYPDGFELVWVDDPGNHSEFQKALRLSEQIAGDE